VVGGFFGLFWSIDGGQSFTKTRASRFGSVAVDPGNADVVYVGAWTTNRGVFKSTDGGRTLQTTGLTTGNFAALAVDPQDSTVVYAGHRTGTVFRSLDGGATFAPAGTGLAGAGVMGLGIERSTRRLYVWMNNGGLFRSEDGAVSWTPVDTRDAFLRSGVTAGRGALAIDPAHQGRIFSETAASSKCMMKSEAPAIRLTQGISHTQLVPGRDAMRHLRSRPEIASSSRTTTGIQRSARSSAALATGQNWP